MSALRAFTRSYMVVLPDYPLPGHQNQGPYISNQAVNPFRPRTKNKGQTVGEKYFMKRLLQLPASRFRVPASRFRGPTLGSGSLPPGLGPASGFRLPGRADSGGYYRPGEDICSLQHVYNSNYWLRPQSLAHQQGPSMLTEAPRHIMLTTAYRQENTLNDASPSSYHSVELGMDRLLNSSIFGNMEGSPYRKFSFSRGKGAVPCTGPRILHSGKPSLPLIARFCHRTRGITCALKSTGVAHSQQASLRQDIAPMEKLWFSDGVLETVEPGALTFPEEEL
ncbi:hypothetical protein DY000_02053556 [Brassica cretica]|uniref:Growth-regulating factor n=1 Tax=Brassica cretica TaxID=69181 RepID=A0ABQ7AJE3_BRACR|nr:hypothetical protein DY000_02053556 [Brassica cretica]